MSYVEDHGILLPGRVPGYKATDLKLLPSSTTKRAVWYQYTAASDLANIRSAKYSTFTETWRMCCPKVTVMKPMTDLCSVCQNNSTAIIRSGNKSEDEKSKVCP